MGKRVVLRTVKSRKTTNYVNREETFLGGKEVNKIEEFLENNNTECHFAKGRVQVCSPPVFINVMKNFLFKEGIIVQDDKGIVEAMKDKLNCDSEKCVVEHPIFIKNTKLNPSEAESIIESNFRPEGPSDSTDLLSNINIDGVLGQLNVLYPKFLHIPFQMSDFAENNTYLAKLDIVDHIQENKYNSFGVVFNTDVSTGRGKHWFCFYGVIKPKGLELEYFNSSGYDMLKSIREWEVSVRRKVQDAGFSYKLKENTGVQYQKDNHSCGVYCLMYIWLRLSGEFSTNDITPEAFTDKTMLQARPVLFT
jgi:hypothetical protein